jgi:octaprenyl-diphosphate synthase
MNHEIARYFQSMPLTVQKEIEENPLTSLHTFLKTEMSQVDRVIHQHLESSVPLIPTIGHHLINAGGKRLRPLLTIASNRLFTADGQDAIGLAAAVEFIHTATLLHDDVIDESNLRRGQPTANALWGNQSAVLVGDFLFARSFHLMIAAKDTDILKILSAAAARIAEGEVLQLSLCNTLDVSAEDCLRVIEAKTAELFAAACQVGALTAHQEKHALALRTYGYNLGMAFQIVDDILDYSANTAQLGKDIGNDFQEGKITLPVILAYSQCSDTEKNFFLRALIDHTQTPDDFKKASTILQERGGLSQAYDQAKSYSKKALEALASLPDHPIKSLLRDLGTYCLHRNF